MWREIAACTMDNSGGAWRESRLRLGTQELDTMNRAAAPHPNLSRTHQYAAECSPIIKGGPQRLKECPKAARGAGAAPEEALRGIRVERFE